MKYEEHKRKQLMDKLNQKKDSMVEDEIEFNILNFIYTIHSNGDDFVDTSYATEYLGALPMTFRKNRGQALGLITAQVNDETRRYIFSGDGFEKLDDLLRLG